MTASQSSSRHLEEQVVADDPRAGHEQVERADALRRPPRPPPRRPRASSRRSGLRDRRSPAPSPARPPRRSRRRRPSHLRTRAASRSRRRCPSRRRSPVLSSPGIWSCDRRYTVSTMEFREILGRRRMHRAFLPDPLPPEQIERIVGVIRRAPSGGFSQGGSIVVVTDDEKRAEIARAFGDEHYSRGGRNFIADAPVPLVISANEALYHARYNEADKLAATGGTEVTWPVPYWFVDAGALMMLVLTGRDRRRPRERVHRPPRPEADLRRAARPAGRRRPDRARADRQAR